VPKIIETVPPGITRLRRTVQTNPLLKRLLQERGGAGADVEERLARLFDVYTVPRPTLTGQQKQLQELRERVLPWHPPRPLTPDEQAFRSGMRDLFDGLPRSYHLRAIYEPPRRLTEDEEAVRVALSGAATRAARLVPAEDWKKLGDKLGKWFQTFLDATGAPTVLEGSHQPHAALLALREAFQSEFPGLHTKRHLNAAVALFGAAVGVVDLADDLRPGLERSPIDADALAALDVLVRKWTPAPRRRAGKRSPR
jgi:hypothetical protein